MGILGRINRVIKSNVNQLVDRMTDPAKEIDLLITEMEEGLKTARDEVISATATSKRAEKGCARAQEECDRWQGRAEQAVRAGDDGLAREALSQKMAADDELRRAEEGLATQRAYVAQLKDALRALETRLSEVKARRGTLKQRARAVKEGGDKGIPGAKAFQDFDRLEARIEAMEETTELSASMDARDAETAARFSKLERSAEDPEIEDELAALKRRMEQGEE